MRPLLNIGEDTNTGGKVSADKVLAALHLAGALPTDIWGHVSDTEYTYVVEIPRALSEREVRDLAIVLDQDAVAQWNGVHGILAGPRAKHWGPFDPARFLTLHGDRLSDTFHKAA
jgi:hypothetical protein